MVAAGFDVATVIDATPGVADEDVLALAARNGQIVVSFDKDFGRLVFVEHLIPAGVILLRFPPRDPELIASTLMKVLRSEIVLVGRFTVVTEERVRSVPL